MLVRIPLSAWQSLAEALRDAEAIGTSDPATDPVTALERVPEAGERRSQTSYTLPLSHRLAVEKIRTELMYSQGLAASRVSRSRVVAAAIALYYEDVFGREISDARPPTRRSF